MDRVDIKLFFIAMFNDLGFGSAWRPAPKQKEKKLT